MKYVAIHKTKKDLPTSNPVLKRLPDHYPLQCEQNFETPEAARAKYPAAIILTEEAYRGYQSAFQVMYDAALAEHNKPTIWKKLNPFKKRTP